MPGRVGNPGAKAGRAHIVRLGDVAVTCWCEARIVWVPPADVGVRTRSCGLPDCAEPPDRTP